MKGLIIRMNDEVYEETKRILDIPHYAHMSLNASTDNVVSATVEMLLTPEQGAELMALWARTGSVGGDE